MRPEDAKEIAAVQALAADAGMRLEMIDVEAWQFRLSFPADDPVWAINLWPCITGERSRERIQHDPDLPGHGPRLYLNRYWTLREAVESAIQGLKGQEPEGRAPVGGRMRRRW